MGNDPTKIGLQIVSEFRSESMNSNSSSETSPLPDYIFHQVTPAATTQQSHLQVSSAGSSPIFTTKCILTNTHNQVLRQYTAVALNIGPGTSKPT